MNWEKVIAFLESEQAAEELELQITAHYFSGQPRVQSLSAVMFGFVAAALRKGLEK
jgi:hypothetical protein